VRVVSLVPSVTETLLAWGVVPVAVTRFCEQPDLRAVGGTKDPDLAAIVELAPDVVVMDDDENRRPDFDALKAAELTVHVTHVHSVDDVDGTLAALARAVGVEPPGVTVPPRTGGSPGYGRRAFVPIWRRPWMTLNAQTYGSSLLARLGIDNVFASHADRFPSVTAAEVSVVRPTVVLLPSEPYPFAERHVEEARQWATDVRLVDGRDLFWWGVRTQGALDRLAQALSP